MGEGEGLLALGGRGQGMASCHAHNQTTTKNYLALGTQPPTTKNYLALGVNSIEVKKPWAASNEKSCLMWSETINTFLISYNKKSFDEVDPGSYQSITLCEQGPG